MAKVIPAGWRELRVTGRVDRELETLELLDAGLPDTLTVFHGVHWTRIERGYSVIGEIDFVIVAPSGRVLLIEQKSGFLKESPDGLVKAYPGPGPGGARDKKVAAQLKRTLDALTHRLAPIVPGESLVIDYLLYCPDYQVKTPATAGLPPERIIDAGTRDTLCRRIIAAFPDEPARDVLAHKLRRFFSDELQLVPDASTLMGRAEQLVTRISGGLATWARRLEFAPFRLRVIGTAGSGKTQLALGVLHDAAAGGRRALYACYNRPLADHIARVAPAVAGIEVAAYHQLADRRLRARGERIDFTRAGAFDELTARFATLAVSDDERVDELVIDEGQDFHPEWVAPLMARLAPGGRVWWMEDPMQNLYGRPPVDLPGFTVMRALTNYRSPRDVLSTIERVLRPPQPLEPASPFAGGVDEPLTYRDASGLLDATKRAITHALGAGFRREDIAIVTFAGRDKSLLRSYDQIGPHRLRAATGRYDMFGAPEMSAGDVLIETVYRFKGQSAPCVIFTEIDFDGWDELVERKLFVGMTRASLRLLPVLSERAAAHWLQRLDAV
ncbi:MAG: ATP-binding domain-containing protein [Burkholderiaceae bacterium]|nr:ATP-binding domain-containing protein [Burkholderiaceae bacterium]